MNLKGEKVGVYNYGYSRYHLVDEDQMTVLGDFWKVLRVRPTPTGAKAQWPTLEYPPNNTYSYCKVKKISMQVLNMNIKPTRYWNETCIKDVHDECYTLSLSLALACPEKLTL